MPDFHLSAIEIGEESEMLERACAAFDDVERGELIILPEYLAWTPQGSADAFARLVGEARRRSINIITTLNLGGELIEDLPGHAEDGRYNALVIFTRHGDVHVPQAKVTPQSFELADDVEGPNIGVEPYGRLNRIQIDMDGRLYNFLFLICSDIATFYELKPAELACDVLVLMGNFVAGAEEHANKLLRLALEHGVAQTALHINAFQLPSTNTNDNVKAPKVRAPLANKVEEVFDSKRVRKPLRAWKSRPVIRSQFYVYKDADVETFVQMHALPERKGRITIAKSVWPPTVEMGKYPITIMF